MLTLEALHVPGRLFETSVTIQSGETVGVIGPNGAGKSTFLKAALGLIPARGGSSLARLSLSARARYAAWLPQEREIAWNIPVEEAVALGRTAHGPQDLASKVDAALHRLELLPLAKRRVQTLSGGEQARVLLARLLAQEAPLVLADEPIANLDPAAQLLALDVLQAQSGATLMALHDLGLATQFCTRLLVFDKGRLIADGAPDEVLSAKCLGEVFQIVAYQATVDGRRILQPLHRL